MREILASPCQTYNEPLPCSPVKRLVALLLVAAAGSGCYVVHVALGQLDVACSSIDVDEALESDDLSDADKAKLRFVQEIRAFAETAVGLDETDNYTTYLPGEKKPLTWVVTGAHADSLDAIRWWFPFIGRVSYLGFFDQDWAQEEARYLQSRGYDVYVRPAAAYSTLGWFTDPITPLMLDLDEADLAFLILHELTHSTVYAEGHTDFNESLADFVGRESALQFLAGKFGPDSAQVRELRDRLEDERKFDDFILKVADELRALYEKGGAADREAAFAGARADFEALRPSLKVLRYDRFSKATLNNAVIIAHLAYGNYTPFESAFDRAGRSWPAFFDAMRKAEASDDPMEHLNR